MLSARRSRRQGRLTLVQEAADGGVALETDCDFVSVAGFGVCACLGQQLRARIDADLVRRRKKQSQRPHLSRCERWGTQSRSSAPSLRHAAPKTGAKNVPPFHKANPKG